MSETENVTFAAVQCALGGSVDENVAKVEVLVREAARKGATVILPPELFEGPYFCREERDRFFAWAKPASRGSRRSSRSPFRFPSSKKPGTPTSTASP